MSRPPSQPLCLPCSITATKKAPARTTGVLCAGTPGPPSPTKSTGLPTSQRMPVAEPPLTASKGTEGTTLRVLSTDIYGAPPGAGREAGAGDARPACPPRRPDYLPCQGLPGASLFPEPKRVRRRAGRKREDVRGTGDSPRTHTRSSEEHAGVGVGGSRGVSTQVHRGGGGWVCEGRRGSN